MVRTNGQIPRSEDLAAGELVNQAISIPLGGNHVRSYLDVIAPDDMPTQEIRNAVVQFINRSHGATLPWAETIGRCTFRFGVEFGLHERWSAEFRQLLLSAFAVRRAA